MRIKADFVTNSSSSSFVVIGVRLEGAEVGKDGVTIDDGLYEFLDDSIKGTDLSFSFGDCNAYYDDSFMVGIKYTEMGEDETLGQFKARVKEQIKSSFEVEKEPGHIEECWEDR